MNAANLPLLLASMVAQWIAAAGSIWLTWWAAQSRDPLPLRVIAIVLVVLPALTWPFMTLTMSMDSGSLSGRAFLFGVVAAGVAVLRALFLAVWAIVSRDRPYLRVVGAIITILLITGLAMQAVSGLSRL